jgi:hypothetical protein
VRSGATVHVHPAVAAVRELYGDLVRPEALVRTRAEQVHVLAERLASGHRARLRGAAVELTNWHPAVVGRSDAEAWDMRLTEPDYRWAVAREHGYHRVDDVTADAVRPHAAFEAAVDALLAGDEPALVALLDRDPELARQRSHWPHEATLLHYATANGVETWRQVVPRNLAALVTIVLERGADVNATAHAYGTDLRPLGLLLTSAHPRDAGVVHEVERALRSAGAR